MAIEESRFSQWSEDWVVEQIASYLGRLEGATDVEWSYQSIYAMYQWLIRISLDQDEEVRLGVGFIMDEEDEEAFDDSFPP